MVVSFEFLSEVPRTRNDVRRGSFAFCWLHVWQKTSDSFKRRTVPIAVKWNCLFPVSGRYKYGIPFPPYTNLLMNVIWNIGYSKSTYLDCSYARCRPWGRVYQITAYERLFNRRAWVLQMTSVQFLLWQTWVCFCIFCRVWSKSLQPIRVRITRACGLLWPRLKIGMSKFDWKWNA